MRKIVCALVALIMAAWSLSPARADTFAATYRELARSPANYATSWFDGDVTRDGKFVYGLGNSHNATGNNGLWLYDPATNTHQALAPNTSQKWLWDKDSNGQTIAKSGRWSDPAIRALTNRNNHQAFSVPWRNEFWVLAGTTFYQASPYFGGRFSLESKAWDYLSPPWADKVRSDLADFADGVVADMSGWVAPNAGTAVCPTIETVVLFGGANDTGGVRIIEPNPAGPEPMRWSVAPKPPFHLPAENMRHNAACVGDTVYFVEGQRRVPNVKCCTTPDPAQFWKFHVPSRTWTRLPDGPPGGYFGVLTADTTAQALLLYGGSASNKLWAYDLIGGQWQNLTGTVPNLPRADMHTGGFVPGFGHIYKGGKRYDATGKDIGYSASSMMMVVELSRTGAAPPAEPPTAAAITWAKLPLPGQPNSPVGSMKHQRLVEGPGGRLYLIGGDWGGIGGEHTGRQEVYSFDPLSPTGDWRLEAPYCGTAAHPVHWHTDEAGVVWDALRKVFWKLAGTEYGKDDSCLAEGKSVKAKVITFDPATKLWTVPPHVAQTRFGYVTNGVLDPDKDQIIQIIDTQAKHLDLTTGQWATYPLPSGPKRFNAIAARLGRDVYWCNRLQVLESYNLDTHKLTTHTATPWPVPTSGWEMQMVMPYGAKVLVVRPTARADTPRHAALYDPASKAWTTLDPGDGWGNTGVLHSSGRLILMGGGIDGPAYHNKVVWVGTVQN